MTVWAGLYVKSHFRNFRGEFFSMIEKCLYCGKEFQQRKRGGNRRKYCCARCKDYSSNRTKYEKICHQCGKKYLTVNTKQKYCSNECRYNSRQILKNQIRKCVVCGAEFTPKVRTAQCCGWACAHIKGSITMTKAKVMK